MQKCAQPTLQLPCFVHGYLGTISTSSYLAVTFSVTGGAEWRSVHSRCFGCIWQSHVQCLGVAWAMHNASMTEDTSSCINPRTLGVCWSWLVSISSICRVVLLPLVRRRFFFLAVVSDTGVGCGGLAGSWTPRCLATCISVVRLLHVRGLSSGDWTLL